MDKDSVKQFLASNAGRYTMTAVIGAVILLLFALILPSVGDGAAIYIIIPFAYFGWKSLNKITPNIFLFMPIVGWLVYFLIKALISCLVGLFVTPFYISKWVSRKIQENIQ